MKPGDHWWVFTKFFRLRIAPSSLSSMWPSNVLPWTYISTKSHVNKFIINSRDENCTDIQPISENSNQTLRQITKRRVVVKHLLVLGLILTKTFHSFYKTPNQVMLRKRPDSMALKCPSAVPNIHSVTSIFVSGKRSDQMGASFPISLKIWWRKRLFFITVVTLSVSLYCTFAVRATVKKSPVLVWAMEESTYAHEHPQDRFRRKQQQRSCINWMKAALSYFQIIIVVCHVTLFVDFYQLHRQVEALED